MFPVVSLSVIGRSARTCPPVQRIVRCGEMNGKPVFRWLRCMSSLHASIVRTPHIRNTVPKKTELVCHQNLQKWCNMSSGECPSHVSPAIDFMEASDAVTAEEISSSFLLYKDFISEEEEQSLFDEVEPHLKRMRYEKDHWDDAISGYRETERKNWKQNNHKILQRIRDTAFPAGERQLSNVHVLDLEKTGYIKPHVDSVRFCGSTIVGLSLLSNCVMRLAKEKCKEHYADVYLPRRSLYVMKGASRYQYTHEVLGMKESFFRNEEVPRDRRISIMCRNEPNPEDEQ